jgi:uncharacterized protein (TIGR03437 family)
MLDKPNSPLLVAFVASAAGSWRIDRINPVMGEGLPATDRLERVERPSTQANNKVAWTLRGVTSNVRYANQNEATTLPNASRGLGAQRQHEPRSSPFARMRHQNQKGRFENTATGYRVVVPMGTGTGELGDYVVVDDPHSVHQAESELTRKRASTAGVLQINARVPDGAIPGERLPVVLSVGDRQSPPINITVK